MSKAFGKTLAAIAAAAAAALLALNGARLVVVSAGLLLAAIVTSAVLGAVTTSAAAWGEWQQRRLGARRDSAEFQLAATLWAVVDQVANLGPAAVEFRDLGLAIYRVRRRWPARPRLVRQYRAKAARRLATSSVTWRPDKGVIGECVRRGEVLGIDLVDLYDGLGSPTAADWPSAPADVRMGLRYQEYLDLTGKYEVVVAVPIIDDHGRRTRVVGCVALDGPHGHLSALSSAEVVDLLNNLVQGLLLQTR